MISASLISKYRQALATLGDSVQVTLANTYADAVARGLVESEIRDLLAEAAWSATSNLGNLASLTAADFYEAIRFTDLPGGVQFQSQLAALPDLAEVQQHAYISARFLHDREGPGGRIYKADPAVFVREFSTTIERYVLDAARNTILESGRVDQIQPRVTTVASPGACEFCKGAMDDGWLLPAHAAQQSRIFHDNCRCFPAPSWDDYPEIEGMSTLPVQRPKHNPF